MAHRRPPLVRGLQLNAVVLVAEIAGGVGSNSFSLIMDGIHNLSDEVALVLLVLAYSLRAGLSGTCCDTRISSIRSGSWSSAHTLSCVFSIAYLTRSKSSALFPSARDC